MIHTIELNQVLTKELYQTLLADLLIELRPDRNIENRVHKECKVLSHSGIVLEFREVYGTYIGYYLYLRLNIGKLIGNNRTQITTISDLQDYNYIKYIFYSYLADLLTDSTDVDFDFLLDLDNWNVRRIDYCVQFTAPIDVEEYIKLLQRGGKPHRGNYIIPYNRNSNHKRVDDELQKTHRSGSVYFKGGKYQTQTHYRNKNTYTIIPGSFNINFYDKQKEMLSILNKDKYTDREIEQAFNIIRIEVQCLPRGIDSLKKRYGFTDKSLKSFVIGDTALSIARSLLLRIYDDIGGKGNYYHKNTLKAFIDDFKTDSGRSISKTKKTLYKGIIDLLNTPGRYKPYLWKREIELANKPYETLIDDDTFFIIDIAKLKRGVKELNHIHNINPIALPDNYTIDEVPSLYSYIDDYFKSQDSKVYSDLDNWIDTDEDSGADAEQYI